MFFSQQDLWRGPALYSCVFLRSTPGPSDSGAVCVGDGVASEHGPGQKLHLALFGERPAAGDVPHRSLGFRTTVSFHAPTSLTPPPPRAPLLLCLLSGCAGYLAVRVRSANLTAELLVKWSGVAEPSRKLQTIFGTWGKKKISRLFIMTTQSLF